MAKGSTKVKTTTVEEKEIPIDAESETPVEPIVQFIPPPVPNVNVPVDYPPSDEEVLRTYFESLGGTEVIIKIYKYDAATNRPRFCQDTDLDGASESYVQQNWGEGRYLLRAYKEGKVLGAKTVHIAPPLKNNAPAAPSPAAPVIVPNPGIDPVLQLQMEQMREDARTNREILMELVKSNMNNGSQKSGAVEIAEIMAILKPVITPPAAASGGNILEILGAAIPLFKQLIDMGANGGAEKPSVMGMVKDLAPDVLKFMGGIVQQRNAPPPPPAYVPSYPNQPVEIPAAKTADIPGIDPQQLAMLRSAIGFLKSRAAKNAPVDTFINYVLDTLDDDQSMAVARLLDRPLEEIAALDPDILSPVYRKWFEEFFGGLRDALSERDTPGGEGSNDPDAQTDVGTDESGNPVRSKNP